VAFDVHVFNFTIILQYENFKEMNKAGVSTGTLSKGLDQLAMKASEFWKTASCSALYVGSANVSLLLTFKDRPQAFSAFVQCLQGLPVLLLTHKW
jgi:hypothetical protein